MSSGAPFSAAPLDEDAVDVADRGAAVVAGDVDEKRVVELAEVVDRVDQPPTSWSALSTSVA